MPLLPTFKLACNVNGINKGAKILLLHQFIKKLEAATLRQVPIDAEKSSRWSVIEICQLFPGNLRHRRGYCWDKGGDIPCFTSVECASGVLEGSSLEQSSPLQCLLWWIRLLKNPHWKATWLHLTLWALILELQKEATFHEVALYAIYLNSLQHIFRFVNTSPISMKSKNRCQNTNDLKRSQSSTAGDKINADFKTSSLTQSLWCHLAQGVMLHNF